MKRPTVEHIGVIVADLKTSLSIFGKMFDLQPAAVREMPEVGLKIARLEAANVSIELIEYVGTADSFGRKVMGAREGINHLCFSIDDMDGTLDDLKRKGIRVMEGFPRPGSHGSVAFFDPLTTGDILMEVSQEPGKEGPA